MIQSVNDVSAHALEIRGKKKEYLLAFFLNAPPPTHYQRNYLNRNTHRFLGTSSGNLFPGHRQSGPPGSFSSTTTPPATPAQATKTSASPNASPKPDTSWALNSWIT